MGRATIRGMKEVPLQWNFNPRPPWGGRLMHGLMLTSPLHFNPRPPWGGRRRRRDLLYGCGEIFQSTPSVGRATLLLVRVQLSLYNFNPRPPWGGRQNRQKIVDTLKEFQSTPSVGRATTPLWLGLNPYKFQSTPSVGRATTLNFPQLNKKMISIHALRGEGDAHY